MEVSHLSNNPQSRFTLAAGRRDDASAYPRAARIGGIVTPTSQTPLPIEVASSCAPHTAKRARAPLASAAMSHVGYAPHCDLFLDGCKEAGRERHVCEERPFAVSNLNGLTLHIEDYGTRSLLQQGRQRGGAPRLDGRENGLLVMVRCPAGLVRTALPVLPRRMTADVS